MEYLKSSVPQCEIAKALQISSSTVHNFIKIFRETEEISVRKGLGWRPLLDACGPWVLRWYFITHRHDSVIDITKWAQEYLQKPLSVNNPPCLLQMPTKALSCKKEPYLNMVQKPSRLFLNGSFSRLILKWTVEKCSYGQTSPSLTFLLEIADAVSSGLKRRETFQHVISVQFKR